MRGGRTAATSAVEPPVRVASTGMPKRKRREAMVWCPHSHAAYKGVRPSLALRFTSARSSSSSCSSSACPFCATTNSGEKPAFVAKLMQPRWRCSNMRAHSSDPARQARYSGDCPSVAHASGDALWMSSSLQIEASPFSHAFSNAVLPLASRLSTSATSQADGAGSSLTTDCFTLAQFIMTLSPTV